MSSTTVGPSPLLTLNPPPLLATDQTTFPSRSSLACSQSSSAARTGSTLRFVALSPPQPSPFFFFSFSFLSFLFRAPTKVRSDAMLTTRSRSSLAAHRPLRRTHREQHLVLLGEGRVGQVFWGEGGRLISSDLPLRPFSPSSVIGVLYPCPLFLSHSFDQRTCEKRKREGRRA